MKTSNNVTKTFAAKSSVSRWAKKELGIDWKDQGTIEADEEGKFYFVFTKNEDQVKEEKAAEIKELEEEAIATETAKKEKTPIVHKSTIGSPCRVVWDIAEEMEGAKRKDVIATCVEAGIAFYTARTQYQKYREAMKAAAVTEVVSTTKAA